MSLPERPREDLRLPSRDAGGGSNPRAVGCHANEIPTPAEPRWGFWATAGFSLVVVAVFVGLQTAAAIGFVVVQIAVSGQIPNEAEAASLGSNGLLLSLATLISMPASLALVCLFAKIKRGATVRGYLGLRGVTFHVGLAWLGIMLLYAAAVDGLTYALGRPIVPEFMVSAYGSAGFLPLLWIALVILAPLFEEIFFRGFMLEGLRHTRLGAIGAVMLTAIAWAEIHLQYDAYQIGVIFVGGLLLGAARIRTGSVLLAMGMHSLQNIIATTEAAVYVHLKANGAG
ncbi:MAG TPA: CPBP family intramembrane glutamic endopeptidase [Pirellulales bacterium]|nr:CPBP family intramembrane glutamic endopeptidase [Pirellulales bacterium]